MKYIIVILLLFSCSDEIVKIENCKMNSIPYIDELTSCKCECLCIGESQKFCVTRNSREIESEEILNGDFELGNQDWILTGDATITQDLLGNWYGGIPLTPNSSYDGTLEQTFTTTQEASCIFKYDAFNNFDFPNIPEAQGRVTVTIRDSLNNIVFQKTTDQKTSESVYHNLNLAPDTYTVEVDLNGATLQTVGQSGVDNMSLVCTVVEFLDCEVVLMPSNTVLLQTDISDSVFCVDIPESTECQWLEVSCGESQEIPLSDWRTGDGDPFVNPFLLDQIEFVQLQNFEVDLECDPVIEVNVTLLDPHVGSEISFDGGAAIPIPNVSGIQTFNYTAVNGTVDVRIQNTDVAIHTYEISSYVINNCKRETIGFKTCEECEKGCLVSWVDKCTGIESSFYIDGSVSTLSPQFTAEEYLSSKGLLSLLGKNKNQKQYELQTDGICDEVFCLLSDATTQDGFKLNGVEVIPTSAGSFDGVGLRNALFTFKKAKLDDESCCC